MKTPFDELMQKANVAQPPEQTRKEKWIRYLPIIKILMEQRSYTLTSAVRWLVVLGEIPKEKKDCAYASLAQVLRRRAKKQSQGEAKGE